ncbi:hypothetical protein PFISCL1PPCAC_20542, partial [Pristionchus fissidentatus]
KCRHGEKSPDELHQSSYGTSVVSRERNGQRPLGNGHRSPDAVYHTRGRNHRTPSRHRSAFWKSLEK